MHVIFSNKEKIVLHMHAGKQRKTKQKEGMIFKFHQCLHCTAVADLQTFEGGFRLHSTCRSLKTQNRS